MAEHSVSLPQNVVTPLFGVDSTRAVAVIINTSARAIYLGLGPNLTSTNAMATLAAGGVAREVTGKAIYGLCTAGSASVQVDQQLVSGGNAVLSEPKTNIVPNVNYQSGNYSATEYDDMIVVDTTAATRTVTLPLAASVPAGQEIIVVKAVAANTLNVVVSGSDTLKGAAIAVTAQWAVARVKSDGVSAWVVW